MRTHCRPRTFSVPSFCRLIAFVLLVVSNHPDAGVLGFVSKSPLSHNSTKKCAFRLNAFSTPEKTEETSIKLNNVVGGLTFAGGLMGYVTKGSKASLIAGSTFGGLLLISASLVANKKKVGSWLGSGVAGMLTYTMGKKFLKSGKFVPAGLIASMGALSFIANVLSAFSGSKTDEPETKSDAETE